MRVLVAGATGAIGQALVRRLRAAGHEVWGTTRTPAKAPLLQGLGAAALVVDGLDAKAVHDAVAEVRPEVVVHEMTALAGALDLLRFDRAFAPSNRLRTAGTDNLLAAARAFGARRFVAQSYCGWPYERTGGLVKSEDDPLIAAPGPQFRRTLDAIRYVEGVTLASRSPEGVVLRYGGFYAAGTGGLDPSMIEQLRRRQVPLIGDGGGCWSFVHIDDAAEATVLAIERSPPGEVYNIVDDDPALVRDWLPGLAALVGAPRPWPLPAWLASFAGKHVVELMTEVRGGSNAKARRVLGWTPAHPSWRAGFAEALAEG